MTIINGWNTIMTNPSNLNLAEFQSRIVASLHDGAQLRHHVAQEQAEQLIKASLMIAECIKRGGKLLLFGNGGSAADAQHIASEFVGRFLKERRALPAIALTTDTSALTAISNDYGYEQVFSRQIEALGQHGDIAIAISTSGNSPSVIKAIETCRQKGIFTFGFTGGNGGMLAQTADLPFIVPSFITARIQEMHLTMGHLFCEFIDELPAQQNMVGNQVSASESKLVVLSSLLKLRNLWRQQNKIVVWTNGCFDLLHLGHIRSLQSARRLGDVLIVGLNSDTSIHTIKGKQRPIISAEHRAEMLAALSCVDHIIIFDDATPASLLSQLQPDIFCKGSDYAPPHGKPVPEMDLILSYGGRIEFLPLIPGLSTTMLIERIRTIA